MKPLFRAFPQNLEPGSWEGHCRIKVHSVKPINSQTIIWNTPSRLIASLWFSRFSEVVFASFSNNMTADAKHFLDYANFLQGERSPEFVDVDSVCLTPELLKDPENLREVVPLYFYLTRNTSKQMSVASLKKSFKCGSDLIGRVRKSIVEKKPIEIPGRKTQTGQKRRTSCETRRHNHPQQRRCFGRRARTIRSNESGLCEQNPPRLELFVQTTAPRSLPERETNWGSTGVLPKVWNPGLVQHAFHRRVPIRHLSGLPNNVVDQERRQAVCFQREVSLFNHGLGRDCWVDKNDTD